MRPLPESLPRIQVEDLKLRAVRQRLVHSPSAVFVHLLFFLLYQILLLVCCFCLCWGSRPLLNLELHLQLELQKLVVRLMRCLGLEVGWELWKFLLMQPLDVPLFLRDGGAVVVYSRPEAEELQLLT